MDSASSCTVTLFAVAWDTNTDQGAACASLCGERDTLEPRNSRVPTQTTVSSF